MDSISKNWIECDINTIVGLTLRSVTFDDNDDVADGDCIIFESECGRTFKMYHKQGCCEEVYIEDICGNFQDLIGFPILVAEAASNEDEYKVHVNDFHVEYDICTWTFYKIDTNKGGVTIRWFGSSNGNYSERANFAELVVSW